MREKIKYAASKQNSKGLLRPLRLPFRKSDTKHFPTGVLDSLHFYAIQFI